MEYDPSYLSLNFNNGRQKVSGPENKPLPS